LKRIGQGLRRLNKPLADLLEQLAERGYPTEKPIRPLREAP